MSGNGDHASSHTFTYTFRMHPYHFYTGWARKGRGSKEDDLKVKTEGMGREGPNKKSPDCLAGVYSLLVQVADWPKKVECVKDTRT